MGGKPSAAFARSPHEISSAFLPASPFSPSPAKRTFAAPAAPESHVATRRQRRHRPLARRPLCARPLLLRPGTTNSARCSQACDSVWLTNVDPRYFNYIKSSVDQLVTPDGSIPTLKPEEHQLDNILLGRQLLFLYGVTQDKRYLTAATFLWNQLGAAAAQRRRRLLAQAALSQPDVARRPLHGRALPRRVRLHLPSPRRIQRHHAPVRAHGAARPRSRKPACSITAGMQSKQERWANKQTGDSPEFWARGIGWYMMALVDTLDYYPEGDPGRAQLIAILQPRGRRRRALPG